MGFEHTVSCTTDGTELGGVRHDCHSDWYIIKAPDDYIINQNFVKIEEVGSHGSEHDYEPHLLDNFGDYVSVNLFSPEIKYPTSFKIMVHAGGPKGYSSGRGGMNIHVSGGFI